MANPEHLKILKQGVAVWNEWREENPEVWPDLNGADLSNMDLGHSGDFFFGADLSDADLSDANLSRTNLSFTNLRGANLSGANLSKANLSDASLSGANLSKANLSDASLSRAYLSYLSENDLFGANLPAANLSKANLSEANLLFAHLSGANLSAANLYGADLSAANLSEADLSEADLSVSILFKTNLSGANLSGAYLSGAYLSGAYLSEANLDSAILNNADFSRANLSGVDLIQSKLIRTNFSNAKLERATIYGLSAWDVITDGLIQKDLIITPPGEPEITVDDLEVAQFIYLMLNNQKIRDVIETITSKAVLILGRFTEERKKVLDALKNELRLRNYLPIVFDFENTENRSLTETVSLLAKMSKFVIADITDAKGIIHEIREIVPMNSSLPIRPLILKSKKDEEYAFFKDFKHHHWLLPLYEYESSETLLQDIIPAIIAPAERKVEELRRKIT